jgi:glycosyltransferase involved in cell wall biosynthesis
MAYYKLAIIIPSWNSSEFVGEMLDGILAQTFQDWQLFCVDDQSTDNTLDILKQYSKQDERIHYYVRDREPKGAQTCRNIGFEFTEGAEYVIWFDSDDLIAPHCFEQRVNYMDRHPELDFGVFPAKSFVRNPIDDNGLIYGFPIFKDDLEAFFTDVLPMVGWTNIYRRQALLENHHKWDERVLSKQDSDFNIQSILKGMKYDYALKENARIDYLYRAIGGLSKRIYTKEHYDSHCYLVNKVIDSLTDEQKRTYRFALQTYCLKFAMKIKNSSSHFKIFLTIPFVQSDKWFYYRLLLWRCCGFRLSYRLFFQKHLESVLYYEQIRDIGINQYRYSGIL